MVYRTVHVNTSWRTKSHTYLRYNTIYKHKKAELWVYNLADWVCIRIVHLRYAAVPLTFHTFNQGYQSLQYFAIQKLNIFVCFCSNVFLWSLNFWIFTKDRKFHCNACIKVSLNNTSSIFFYTQRLCLKHCYHDGDNDNCRLHKNVHTCILYKVNYMIVLQFAVSIVCYSPTLSVIIYIRTHSFDRQLCFNNRLNTVIQRWTSLQY